MRYFKIIPPDEFVYQYNIILKDNTNNHIIGCHKLDLHNKEDVFIFFFISKFDKNSIIEFYGKKYIVKDWSINHIDKEITIFI